MTKEKLASLTAHMNKAIDNLNGPVPEKHAKHPDSYHNFLRSEIETIKKLLEEIRLQGVIK